MKKLNDIQNKGIELNSIYNEDCLSVMRLMKDKSIDLVLTDPPYGIDYNNEKLRRKSNSSFSDIVNDKKGDIDFKELIKEFQRISRMTIVFGAINFFQDLPYKGIWICWDKRTTVEADRAFGSPFELAWCDKIGGYDKIYRVMHGGVINNDNPSQKRFHPTQKPIDLMKRIITDFSTDGIIFDPFLGSGTTALACEQLKRNFIGCEIASDCCAIAQKRLDNNTMNLF